MRWRTIYISGREGFENAVVDKLTKSDLDFLEGSKESNGLLLVWLQDQTNLVDLKKAISAKVIFKYRLRFFNSLEEHHQTETAHTLNFTPAEEALVKKMHDWQDSMRRYSA